MRISTQGLRFAYLWIVGHDGWRMGAIAGVRAQLDGLAGKQLVAPDLLHLLQHLLVDALVQERVPHICDDVLDHGMVHLQLRARGDAVNCV